jgi:hypothetical protein
MADPTPGRRQGAILIGTLPAGTRIAELSERGWIAVHPDHPPRLVTAAGIVDLPPADAPASSVPRTEER